MTHIKIKVSRKPQIEDKYMGTYFKEEHIIYKIVGLIIPTVGVANFILVYVRSDYSIETNTYPSSIIINNIVKRQYKSYKEEDLDTKDKKINKLINYVYVEDKNENRFKR